MVWAYASFVNVFIDKTYQGCHSLQINLLISSLGTHTLEHLISVLKIVGDKCGDSDLWPQCPGGHWGLNTHRVDVWQNQNICRSQHVQELWRCRPGCPQQKIPQKGTDGSASFIRSLCRTRIKASSVVFEEHCSVTIPTDFTRELVEPRGRTFCRLLEMSRLSV